MSHDTSQSPADRPPALRDRPESIGRSWRSDLVLLLAIAGPNVTSTIAQTLLSIVDFWIVSKLPNAPEAQAAVSSSGMIFFSVFAFLLGTLMCVTTMVSQSLGARRYRDCAAYAWQGIWISVVLGSAAALLWPVIPGLYAWIGHAPAVQAMETSYTQIRFLSLGAAGATLALANFFNGIHRPGVNALSVVVANVLNAVLSYGLVLGKWGLPAMGVEGAAWGTLIATLFRTVWMLWAMRFSKAAARFGPMTAWRLNRDKMRRLLRIGWPAGLALVLDIGAWTVFMTAMVGRFGTTHLAATATVWRFLELSFMPAVGIGAAISTIVGRAVGRGRPDLARRLTVLGVIINVIYMSLMGTTYLVFGDQLMRFFSQDAAVIALGVQLLICAAVFQFFDAFGITYSSALRGAGDTRWPAAMGAIQAWLIMVCGGLWVIHTHPELGSRGPWIFATAFIMCIGMTLLVRWRRGKWERMDVIGRTDPLGIEVEPAPAEP